jgi:hypothetical protein
MKSDTAKARRNARTKLLLAACGIAGCTGGPKLTSATTETPSALVQPADQTQTAGSQETRSFLASRSTGTAQSIWGGHAAAHANAPVDPFATNRSGGFRSVPPTRVARRAPVGVVQPVGFEDTSAYCGTPSEVTIQPRPRMSQPQQAQQPPGVVHIKDNRLPPAAPLGAANPFHRTQPQPTIQATPVANHLARKPAPSTRVQIQPSSRHSEATVPMSEFLSGRVAADGSAPEPVRHEDMIVDSAILPKRTDWRSSAVPTSPQDGSNPYIISARRPFATPEWDDPAPQTTSSANLPIEISPAASFDAPSAAMQLAKRSELPGATDIAPPAAVPAPIDLPADPFAEATFAPAPPLVAPEDEPLAIAAAPMLAPGSVVSSQPTESQVAGPALTIAPAPPTVTEEPAGETNDLATAEPVQLTAASETEAKDRSVMSAPAVIGLALALVAFGAVVIRRRFV